MIAKSLQKSALVGAFALFATEAFASPFVFDLTATPTQTNLVGGVIDSLLFESTVGTTTIGLSLTHGYVSDPPGGSDSISSYSTGTANGQARLTQDGTGVGVETNLNDGSSDIDGNNPLEAVKLLFDVPVLLTSVTFGAVDNNDHIHLWVYDVLNTSPGDLKWDFFDSFYMHAVTGNAANPVEIDSEGGSTGPAPVGTGFAFSATDSNDDFRLVSITAEYSVSTVPLPTALPLFLSGLAGLGFLGMRRKHRRA